MHRRRRQRRGVLLLIVLSLLVLFLLVGLSFMVAAGQFERLAKSAARSEATGMPGHKLADSVLYQLMRGTRNQYSSIQGHSLLEDLYGRDYMIAEATQVIATPNEQVQELRFTPSTSTYGETYSGVDPIRPEARDDYYAGCVLTFLNGNVKGHSTRILEYKTSGAVPVIRIAGVSVTNKKTGVSLAPQVPNANTPLRFLVNGRPFNGTGAGYNPVTGTLNNAAMNVPLAFLPNYRAYAANGVTPSVAANFGGLDESYDCVDYQNMFLGKSAIPFLVNSAISEPASPFIQYIRNTGGATPSFHRPYLLRHLFTQPSTASSYDAIKHLVSMRPSQVHHPSFTGSNPTFDEHFGPWDVDNDGDGIPDSVWIDAGLAPVSAPDGRLYKPLVAIQIIDMDGRVNINAAGSLEHVLGVGDTILNTDEVGVAAVKATVPVGDQRAFGMGYGPADISITNGGLPTKLIQSRYRGYDRASDGSRLEKLDGNAKENFLHWTAQSAPGMAWHGSPTADPATASPQFPSNDDATAPYNFSNTLSLLSWHGSPADYHGRGIPFLDAAGNLLWMGPFRFGQYEGLDDPYEVNLIEPTTHDSPYGFSDLMTLNRVNTKSRLVDEDLYGPLMAFNSLEANSFTTHSFSVPALPSINPGRFRSADGLRRSLRDMFAAKIRRARGIQPQDAGGIAKAYEFAERLMAPEFARGEKLNLNRALQPNLVPSPVQSPQDYAAQELPVLQEKARFARHLFNLMMLLTDANSPEQVRRIAQWSINVVDFGDADSVMTRFQYDPTPFDESYDPNPFDNNVFSGERVIWGMEHPELLLTETLALHDRLLEDGDPGGLGDEDDDLDSIEEPEGSLFIELYCPRSKKRPVNSFQLASRGPEDIYTPGNDQRLDLSRIVMNDDDPVWRIAITEPIKTSNIQDSRQEQLENGQPLTQKLDLSRFIYFTRSLPVGADPKASFYNTSVPQVIMNPGTYLLLAPRDITDVGSGANRISLAARYPSLDTDAPAGQYNLSRFGQAIVVESNDNNGCNVSEPLGGYDDSVLDPTGSDESLDALEGVIPYDVASENETEFIENFRTVLLQRLANPNMPFHATHNPYLTLDWIPVDVTVFNSGTGTPSDLEVVSRERTGRHNQLQVGSAEFGDASFNIWSAWSDIQRNSNGQTLTESLGQLNDFMGPPNAVNGQPIPPVLREKDKNGGISQYAGAPAQFDPPGSQRRVNLVNGLSATLSSLVWHNRPYANPYELMLVPATSSDRLTGEYTVSNPRTPYVHPLGTFGHLLNFFESSSGIPGEATAALNAFRIFDFVAVPSRFMGTQKTLVSSIYPAVSEFREPGKVNLNTAIRSTLTRVGCDSLLSDDASRPTNRDALMESLHGYQRAQVSGTVVGYFPDGSQPAEISNPYRAGVASDLIGQLTPTTSAAVDATLLRSKLAPLTDGSIPAAAGQHPQPALAPFDKPVAANAKEFDNLALQNTRRNAYFRYRDLMKMGNSITSQSNVYAVWITVGYFEIEPNYDPTGQIPYFKDAIHPDGYRYGIEMGSDVGQVIRDRAFYVVDRSIPVAFEPGVNHNVDKAVLVRRQLE